MLNIIQGKPIPPKRGPRSKYPFAHMKVGDSFVAPTDNPARKRAAIQRCIHHFKVTTGLQWKFTMRSTDEGVQVWRTE